MFTIEQLTTLAEHKNDYLTVTPDLKFGLYKFDRGDRLEVRMEALIHKDRFDKKGSLETILRFYISKEEDLVDTLYIMLRNCLLVERETK